MVYRHTCTVCLLQAPWIGFTWQRWVSASERCSAQGLEYKLHNVQPVHKKTRLLCKTHCPPVCLVKIGFVRCHLSTQNSRAPQCVCMGEGFCGLHDTHVRIIWPVCDISHVRKCTRPSPTASDGKLGEGLRTREISSICGISWDTPEEPMSPGIPKDAWDNPRCPYQGGVHVSWILRSYKWLHCVVPFHTWIMQWVTNLVIW